MSSIRSQVLEAAIKHCKRKSNLKKGSSHEVGQQKKIIRIDDSGSSSGSDSESEPEYDQMQQMKDDYDRLTRAFAKAVKRIEKLEERMDDVEKLAEQANDMAEDCDDRLGYLE